MVFIKRADRIVNEYIFEIVELLRFAIIDLDNISHADYLIEQTVKNAPDEVALFTFRDFDILDTLVIAALKRKSHF